MINNQEQSRESQLNQNEDQQLALQFMMDLQSQNRVTCRVKKTE